MEELIEVIKSIRNRCDVVQMLYDVPGKLHLIPTILEDLYEDAEFIIEKFCVEKHD